MNKYVPPIICCIIMLTGCQKEEKSSAEQNKNDRTLTLKVKNISKNHLYAACFSYMKKEFNTRWRWHKSNVFLLSPKKEISIPLGTISDKQDLNSVYGMLGIFKSQKQAEDAIYELLPDNNKIDLDRLYKLKDQTLIIGVEKYGVTGDIFDYDIIPNELSKIDLQPELDFKVENRTGKPLYVTAFIYQKKDDMPVWRYDKAPLIRIDNGATGVVDVDTLQNEYDHKYTRGYLAVFEEDEKQEAETATYELLKPYQKVSLGILAKLNHKRVVLNNQKYGILGDTIEFSIKEPRRIDFAKYAKK